MEEIFGDKAAKKPEIWVASNGSVRKSSSEVNTTQ